MCRCRCLYHYYTGRLAALAALKTLEARHYAIRLAVRPAEGRRVPRGGRGESAEGRRVYGVLEINHGTRG
jgi:hypothetical protein